ncbi:MAG: VTT domain-containing protein [Gammaproteobacteria bacterium]
MTEPSILKPGENCWRIEQADRVRFLIDGADYFHVFRETAKNAQRSILIIGWDLDSRFALERSDPGDGLPTQLADFLDALVQRNEDLHIHVLDWDFAMIYMPDREWLPAYKMDWTTHRRLRFRLDNQHPVGASHHQKLIVVDDQVAFAGGLDLTFGRWDTSEHRPDDPRRQDNNGPIPQPYHDVQMMVGGEVARALGELARERWHTATGRTLEPVEIDQEHTPWPEEISADLTGIGVAIARTYPRYNGRREIREVERLVLDAIAGARDTIYIENQFLTAPVIRDALAERLNEDDGPEVVIVLPQQTVGWLSQVTMDVLRERFIRHLQGTEHADRLRVYYPHVPGLKDQCVNVHAKVLIIDDALVRVGSSNFNNRSMGLDTECDLAIETGDEAPARRAVASLRNRLLAEHLDVTPAAVDAALEKSRSLIGAIESLIGEGRTLKPLPLRVSKELDASIPETAIADPEQPIDAKYLAKHLVPDEDKPPTQRTLVSLAALLAVALALAASWRWTPLGEWIDIKAILNDLAELRGDWVAPLVVSAIYIVGGLIAFPVSLLIVATGVAFGAVYGFAYALLGAELSALVTYAVGYYLGHDTLQRLSHQAIVHASRRLARQGLIAVITLRIVPVAPFTVINLAAGASHIRFRDFALGSLLGMAPGILALTLFSDQVAEVMRTPELAQHALLLTAAVAVGAATWLLSRWLLKRQKRQRG